MSRDISLHTQVVGWLRILLPLGALILLSTLFLIARGDPAETEIPFAQIDAVADEQRIGAPRFTGLTDTGDSIALTATSAQPGATDPDLVDVTRPRLALDGLDGTSLRVTAGNGTMNTAAQQATLTGLARLDLSTGYAMETAGLNADLATGVITSDGALAIKAPYGDLTAGQARIQLSGNGKGTQLQLSDGVRLVFVPQQTGEE
ncbi:lipopolysaccharide export system protein LptC [Loktanella sp. DSM 29012]|uniref:LPS export ABC transporter periplasmic protein LptC n=1 Tax=Loktanella sp. DSM 29012 TaxID=1881056 RepID=UPI0008AD4E9A|nr:LPS export ABC transporter periplasmic protein LptC [Loktanella sp. DSM 29012]SEP58835.1 lipopolysaccharide export system protein LptC [Loktanella sp. DSM 29012]